MKNFSRYSVKALVAAFCFGSLCTSAAQAEVLTIQPDPLGPLVPQALLGGDREFDGNGPDVRVWVRLEISNDKRRLNARVYFHAKETKPDWSETEGEWVRTVWIAPTNIRIVRILSDHYIERRRRSGKANPEIAGIHAGGHYMALVNMGEHQWIKLLGVIGDTPGDDISTDSNPDNDTHIKQIIFNPAQIEVENTDASPASGPDMPVRRDERTTSSVCSSRVQGQVEWNTSGNKTWAQPNIDALCAGAESYPDPAQCFEGLMKYRNYTLRDTPDVTLDWRQVIAICRGTRNYEATLNCAKEAFRNGDSPDAVARRCAG